MARIPVHVRDATSEDAWSLRMIWTDFSKRYHGDRSPEQAPQVVAESAVERITADPGQRLLVALTDGEAVGAVHLRHAPVSPICDEAAIHVSHLHVLDGRRRHGAGRALVEAAVSWAEEMGTGQILAAASVNSREANRFMARLGLCQVAIVRASTVAALRARLPVEPVVARTGNRSHRNVAQILAERRSLQRSRAK